MHTPFTVNPATAEPAKPFRIEQKIQFCWAKEGRAEIHQIITWVWEENFKSDDLLHKKRFKFKDTGVHHAEGSQQCKSGAKEDLV